MSEAVVPMPMFPLETVLFPSMHLPLHVFEPRYRALAHDLTTGSPFFGVVLIERGSEVGGGDVRFSVGTVARLVEALELPDGRWQLLAKGEERIRVHTWLPDDPYPLALVERLRDSALPDAAGAHLLAAERSVRQALAHLVELGRPVVSATVELDPDRTRAAFQLAGLAPIPALDKQRLLELDEPAVRIAELARQSAEVAALLADELARG